MIKTDLCIIGAGSGGLSLAAGATQLGAQVVLIEGGQMGGDCLNHGCVPSKALIAAAKHAYLIENSSIFGIKNTHAIIDFPAVKNHIAQIIDEISPMDSQERFEKMGVSVLRSWARFISPDCVQSGDMHIKARRFIIATGAENIIPPIKGLEDTPYLTNKTIFTLKEKPDHLIILGGGPTGLEMAQAHRRLGCKVTVIERTTFLKREDPELSRLALALLKNEDINLYEQTNITEISYDNGQFTLKTDPSVLIQGSHLLVAAGRIANLTHLNLDKGKIAAKNGAVHVNDNLRSISNRRVYAIGDAAGGPQFTHVASYHAKLVAQEILFGLKRKVQYHLVPRVTYMDPELAQIGMTEPEATQKYGKKLTILRYYFKHNDRAQTERRTKGLIKVMVIKGRPVGVSIFGASAGELISLWGLAISKNLRISDIANMISPYPSLNEISQRISGSYFSLKFFDKMWLKQIVRLFQRLIP